MHMLSVLISVVLSVDRSKYRKCEESMFCTRDRYAEQQNWSVVANSWKLNRNTFEAVILDEPHSSNLQLTIAFLECGAVRLRIEPTKKEDFARFDCAKEPTIVNQDELSKIGRITMDANKDRIVLIGSAEQSRIEIQIKPFLVTAFDKDGRKRISLNEGDNAVFETGRNKEKEPDLFKSHSWGGHEDQFKNGPTSVAMNVDFHLKDTMISGLPSHTLPVNLIQTANVGDPIRLFNTDINGYEVDSGMAMYGAIPFVLGHSIDGADGVFWCNPSETWADIVTNDIKRVRMMSEGGYIDIFWFSGTPKSVVDKYTKITGRPQLVPLFGLGFHQCRWGYLTAKEVMEVDKKLDSVVVPHDVLWLDLDYTNDRKYFTFHPTNFKNPENLLDTLNYNKRHLVVLIDPHLKKEKSYETYKEALDNDLLIKEKDGVSNYVGNCWPGKSSWPDFLNPDARSWWETNYDFQKFKQSKPNLHIWNDMNEIAVFDSCDLTAPRDLIHFGNIEEREVHNIYGHLMVSSSFGGLVKRDKNQNSRPFILTRSFFAGSQKYALVWTGDNTGNWKHLANSLQMVLTYGFSSQVYSGADIGGFFESPDQNLLSRWYQVGAWLYPFYRCHCHHLSAHRELYTLKDDYFNAAREALVDRYKLLYYWYSLARNANLTGEPIVRPLWWEFNDERFVNVDDKAMVGSSLFVVPFLEENQKEMDIVFPNCRWYSYRTLQEIQEKEITVENNGGRVPVFIKGGSIIPIKPIVRKSSELMFWDPFQLIIALDENERAEGDIYVDDGKSFDFMRSNFLSKGFIFDNNKLKSYYKDQNSSTSEFLKDYDVIINQISITGLKNIPQKVLDSKNNELTFINKDGTLIIKNLSHQVKDDIEITLKY